MFSPTVSAPLTCSSGSSRGAKPLYCSISAFDLTSNAALSSGVHQSLRLPDAVVLRALVVEAVADLVADDRADAAVVLGRLGVRREERLLQDAGREADLVGAGVVVGVDGLRQHEPLVAVDRGADLAELAVGLERRRRRRRCRAGRRAGSAARSSRGTSRGRRSWAGRCRASRRRGPWSPRSSSPAGRSTRGRRRAGWRPGRPSAAWRTAGSGGRRTPCRPPRRSSPRPGRRRASSARAARGCR